MRLRRLALDNYGSFAHAELAFETEPGAITLVVAPNGAGKSVLRQAFHDLLFDIPLQSPMRFRHGYPGMALHAEALAADGTAFEFGWQRQGKPPRVTTDPARYAALRAAVTPQQVEQLFALDTQALRRGGTDLKGGTTLAGALLAGTGELASAKAVKAEIELRRQANWGQGRSKPPLNAAIAALDTARSQARAAVQRPEKRERQELELEQQRGVHEAARRDHDAARQATRRLNRIALTRPHLQMLAETEAWFAANPQAPALPEGLDRRLADARAAMATAQATLKAARQALDSSEAAAEAIVRDTEASRFAGPLAELPGRLGEVEKAGRDIVARRTERQVTLGLVGTALRDIGSTAAAEQAAALIPPAAVIAEARAAITRHAGLRTALELAEERLRKTTLAQAAAERQGPEVVPLPAGLVELLQEIRADRNPAQHLAETQSAARTAQAQLRALLAAVPGWAGTAEALRGLAPAAETAFERLDAALREAALLHRDRIAEQTRLEAERHAAQAKLAGLRTGSLPDAHAIDAARASRERGWKLILRRAFSPLPPDLAAEELYAGGEPLPLAYERQVRAADDLADRRSAELDRVNDAERLEHQLAALDPALAAATSAAAAAETALAASRSAWAAACAPCCLEADATMADLRGFMAARTLVIAALQTLELAGSTADDVVAVQAGWAARLATLLKREPQTLPALLALADARIKTSQAAVQAEVLQQARSEAARRERVEAEDALARAADGFGGWQAAWQTILAGLGRPPDETPEVTGVVLDHLATLDRHDREARALADRIGAMQADLDGFAAEVAGLAKGLQEAVLPIPAETARALIARGVRAAGLESGWAQAQAGLLTSRKALAKAEDTLRSATLEFDATIAAVGAIDAEDADRRIALSREHASQATRRQTCRDGLVEHGDGLSHADLQAEAEAVPPVEMTAARAAAEAAAIEADDRAEAAAVLLDRLQAAFDADGALTTATDSRADYEAAAATYARRLEEQIVLHVASTMLSQAMETVEHSLGDSSLAKVSRAFSDVTGGAYGIALETDGETLYAVEHSYPEERKGLAELSEGTRDQLYLALRLVALRDHCAGADPLPFIADDILQTFDDVRARASLQALVTLSADLQVIVLTHHPHLAEIARTLPAGSVRLIHL